MSYIFSLDHYFLLYRLAVAIFAISNNTSLPKYVLGWEKMCDESICLRLHPPKTCNIPRFFCTSIIFTTLAYSLAKLLSSSQSSMSDHFQHLSSTNQDQLRHDLNYVALFYFVSGGPSLLRKTYAKLCNRKSPLQVPTS